MKRDRFSRQLQLSLEQVRPLAEEALTHAALNERALLGLSVDDLVRLVRDSSIPTCEQGALWAAVLRSYRRGSADAWGAVLLEMLAPALVSLSKRLSQATPIANSFDIQQQLVIETLVAARHCPAADASRPLKHQLVLEIKRRVRRWLGREFERRAESLEALAPDDDAQSAAALMDESTAHWEDAVWELAYLRDSPAAKEDLGLLWRLNVRGESLAAVAREMGCSPKAVDCRRRRARTRLQRQLAA